MAERLYYMTTAVGDEIANDGYVLGNDPRITNRIHIPRKKLWKALLRGELVVAVSIDAVDCPDLEDTDADPS